MNLIILRIADNGILEKERIVLKAVADVDVGSYILAQTGVGVDRVVTNKIHNNFWFPDAEIVAGDLVVLYTKSGKSSTKENGANKSYFYYWGKPTPVWNIQDRTAVIMEISSWERLAESDETTE
ncbi:hypothetical protein HX864_16610 [Pseudomonas yamanorum]|uniref:hypothetical protein n=1 Tax=Pseudomonas yamanorum TaxID=515393 RepID=UPI0015A2FD1F|nr:hypothetical protein [Pseudomonas yamanorum]NWD24896.1 hypothetical protein [Pseudomonas yamanorum]